MYDLKKISLHDAINLAVAMSGKSREEIGAEMGWSPAVTRRIFTIDNYWPSLPSIPKLCSVLGNTIIIDWLAEQSEEYFVDKQVPTTTPETLIKDLGGLFKEIGDVATQGNEALEDGKLTTIEARRIIKELYDVIKKAMHMIGGLRKV